MKNNLKQIALSLVIIMTLSLFAFSGSVSASSFSFDMNELGITAGMNPEQRENEYVRRDEFAQMVVNMMQQQDVAKSLENAAYFTDVADSQYKGAINLLAKMEYISGSGNGEYRPAEYLTYGAACKILVHALGYDKIVEDSSLNAYQFVAGTIKLTNNVDSSAEYMTFAQTMLMIHNALDIGLMVPSYYNANIAPSYEIDEGRTYRSMLYGRNGNGIVKMRGMVTADVSTYLYSEIPNIKDTQLEISGKVYDFADKAPLGFVGQIVDYYITIKDYEEGKITAIEPVSDNVVYDFTGFQVIKASSSEIEFENNGKITVKLDEATRYIYNNRIDMGYKMSYNNINDNMVIRTVDNNDDGVAEVVYIYEYANCVVEKVYTQNNMVVLKDGYTFGKVKNIQLDSEKIYFEIYNSKGNLTDISAITENAVVSIAQSINKDCIRIVVCTDTATGDIISKGEDEVVVGNTTYLCAETVELNDLKVGSQVNIYLNFLGKIVYFEEIESENVYAYVYTYSTPSGLGNYKVKLLMPTLISVKTVEGETNDLTGEVSTSQSLFVRNSDVVVYEAEAKIIFNGTRINAAQVLPNVLDKPVAYAVNENGRLYKIDTLSGVDDIDILMNEALPKQSTNLYNKVYNGKELVFGGGRGEPFGIQKDHTLAFCVPKYTEDGQTKDNIDEDDLKVMVELKTGVGYEANGYEQDEDTLIADVLVIQQIMQSGQAGMVNLSSDVALVLKVFRKIDDDGNEVLAVKMLTDGAEKTTIVSSLVSNQGDFERLNKGDLIAYSLDGFDQLNAVEVLRGINQYYESDSTNAVCADIKNIEYNKISNSKIRWVHNVYVGYENEDSVVKTLEILAKSPAPIFVIESENEMRVGSVDDLQIGDKIFTALNSGKVRAIVINRVEG